jgi:hypothetical protein
VKKILLVVFFAALSAGVAGTGYAQYGACVNNNSKACVDARNAFAEHHGGQYPQQYYNHYYQGRPGRWSQQNNNWRWEGMDGDEYSRGDRGWEWKHHKHEGDHDHHGDHDDH